ncbi:MAG TPA: hypothetical protein ENH60_02150 [Pricia sp.]|nr:hypothetical protein [Pricia sp.]
MREIRFQKVLETQSATGAAKVGEYATTPDGRIWRYVKANEALVLSNALTRIANSDQDTVASTTDGAGDETIITQVSAGFTVGDFNDAYGLVDSGTGKGQFFKIKTNDATRLFLFSDYALSTTLVVGDSDIVIVRPYLAEKTATSTLNQIPLGIAQVAFTSGDFGYALISGPGSVLAGAALVANELCTPGDNTEGTLITVASGETVDDVSSFGRTLVANDTADVAGMIMADMW